jgi:hypothetical protein
VRVVIRAHPDQNPALRIERGKSWNVVRDKEPAGSIDADVGGSAEPSPSPEHVPGRIEDLHAIVLPIRDVYALGTVDRDPVWNTKLACADPM